MPLRNEENVACEFIHLLCVCETKMQVLTRLRFDSMIMQLIDIATNWLHMTRLNM